jgi:hypothetical protein
LPIVCLGLDDDSADAIDPQCRPDQSPGDLSGVAREIDACQS